MPEYNATDFIDLFRIAFWSGLGTTASVIMGGGTLKLTQMSESWHHYALFASIGSIVATRFIMSGKNQLKN